MSAGGVAWVALARCVRPQGRKGEVLAEVLTDFPERIAGRPRLYLATEGFAGAAEAARPCEVLRSWMPKGRNEGRIVLEIAGVGTMEEAAALAGQELLVAASDRAVLEENSMYISDLVGCALVEEGVVLGTVEDVQFPMTADGRRRLEQASPLLVVRLAEGRGEVMVPYAKEFLRGMDAAARVVTVRLPEGLLELAIEEGAAD